jgi:hypothetical protein
LPPPPPSFPPSIFFSAFFLPHETMCRRVGPDCDFYVGMSCFDCFYLLLSLPLLLIVMSALLVFDHFATAGVARVHEQPSTGGGEKRRQGSQGEEVTCIMNRFICLPPTSFFVVGNNLYTHIDLDTQTLAGRAHVRVVVAMTSMSKLKEILISFLIIIYLIKFNFGSCCFSKR